RRPAGTCNRCVALFFSGRRRHTSFSRDWSSDVCSSDLEGETLSRIWELITRNDEQIGRDIAGLFPAAVSSPPPGVHVLGEHPLIDRKSVVEGKSVEGGGRGV